MPWLSDPDALRLTIMGVVAVIALVFVVRTVSCTDNIRDTITAIVADTHAQASPDSRLAPLRVSYGRLRLPFTCTLHPTRILVSVPAGRVPHLRDEETANRVGAQIRDTYGMDGVTTSLHRGMRYWELTR